MILMKCPEFPERHLLTLGSAMGKSTAFFKRILRTLRHAINGSKEQMRCYRPTYISGELIKHGYGPFDYKNRSFSTNVNCKLPPKEGRENLKELIVWLCKTVKSQYAVLEGVDPLRGEEPSLYGLSMKEGK